MHAYCVGTKLVLLLPKMRKIICCGCAFFQTDLEYYGDTFSYIEDSSQWVSSPMKSFNYLIF